MTLDEILADLEDQIAWRGPSGQPQGHVVIPRSEAQELLNYVRPFLQPRADLALKLASENLMRIEEHRALLTEALLKALTLQDAMLSEIRRLGQGAAPFQLIAAKSNFDSAMKRLLARAQSQPQDEPASGSDVVFPPAVLSPAAPCAPSPAPARSSPPDPDQPPPAA